jgi:hypothetical protein
MSSGPIEFLSDGEVHRTDPGEYGGADGLIQPENSTLLRGDPEASGGHTLDSDKRLQVSENRGIMTRRAMEPLPDSVGSTGVETRWGDDEIVDPVTGRTVAVPINKKGSGGARGSADHSDLKP